MNDLVAKKSHIQKSYILGDHFLNADRYGADPIQNGVYEYA
jgi:hypothetical protein